MFHNEYSVLEWRFRELDAVVDDFIVVESVLTHSGQPRKLAHLKRDPRFRYLGNRLHAVVDEDPPHGPDPWSRERAQRTAIWTLGASLISKNDDDLIIISDADEVPFPDIVDMLARSEFRPPLRVRPHWFNFDWDTYLGPREHASIDFYMAGFLRRLCESGRCDAIGHCSAPAVELTGLNGWHASWFGDEERIIDKLRASAHAHDHKDQLVAAEGVQGIRRRRASGYDIHRTRRKVSMRPRLPRYGHLATGTGEA